jgi:hypothetical protein
VHPFLLARGSFVADSHPKGVNDGDVEVVPRLNVTRRVSQVLIFRLSHDADVSSFTVE